MLPVAGVPSEMLKKKIFLISHFKTLKQPTIIFFKKKVQKQLERAMRSELKYALIKLLIIIVTCQISTSYVFPFQRNSDEWINESVST